MRKYMKILRLWGIPLELIALTGCVVGPSYQGPPATELRQFHQTAAVAAREIATSTPSTPVALDDWWTGFNDSTLTRIVERALNQNLDLAASIARVDKARAAAREA